MTDGPPPAAGRDALETPAPAAAGRAPERAPVVGPVLSVVATGAARLVWWWPGLVVTLGVYGAVAGALYHGSYPNLWGGLAAGVAATAWYGSPMRRLEEGRRLRLRAGLEP